MLWLDDNAERMFAVHHKNPTDPICTALAIVFKPHIHMNMNVCLSGHASIHPWNATHYYQYCRYFHYVACNRVHAWVTYVSFDFVPFFFFRFHYFSSNLCYPITVSFSYVTSMSKTEGERPYGTGEMQSMQYGAIVGQVNLAHQPPMVRFIWFHLFLLFLFELSHPKFSIQMREKGKIISIATKILNPFFHAATVQTY